MTTTTAPAPFWMITGAVVGQDEGAPYMRYEKKHRAYAEASRLAVENPGKEFFVLQAISVSRSVSIETVKIVALDEVPF